MAGRSWDSFASQQRKYGELHSSKDFRRRKPGVLSKLKSFFMNLFGR